MADVFLSYARADLEKAERIKEGLEAAGLTVFFDVEGLDGGDVFPDVLDREVKGAGAVVSLWSPHALTRPWVKQECSVGLKRKCLIPAAIEPLGELDVPVAFEGMQVVDLTGFHGNIETPEWRQLLRALARTLKRPDLVPAAPARPARGGRIEVEQQSGKPLRAGWIVAGVAVAGLVLLAPSLLSSDLFRGSSAAEGTETEEAEAAAQSAFVPPPAGVTELQPGTECGDLQALVYFDFDKADLNADGVGVLEEALQRGFGCELYGVRVEGHDNLLSDPSYAEGLSRRRAEGVAALLEARGVRREVITTLGYGSTKPLQPGQSLPNNRRALVVFDYDVGALAATP